MAGQIDVTLTPSVQGNQTKWNIAVGGHNGGHGSYPDIPAGKGSTPISFTIVNGNGWTFPTDGTAIWVTDNGQDPTGPSSVPSEINPNTIQLSMHNAKLSLVDSNGKAGTLNYTLNFVNGAQHSSTLDPIIDNGGPSNFTSRGAEYLWYALGAIAVIVIIVLVIRMRRGTS